MPIVTLQYDRDEEEEQLHCALNGHVYRHSLEEMWDKLFRPRHKHGYSDVVLNELLGIHSSAGEESNIHIACNKLMDILEDMYREIRKSEEEL